MEERELLDRFEATRTHLRAVAYRLLGSLSEADDALQEAWLRLNRTDASRIENLEGWLTRVVARICLNMLRTRRARPELALGVRLPDPVVSPAEGPDPEHEALIAEDVGLAMLVVLDTLSPPERVAFVLHDAFGVSFAEVAPLVGRTPAAARQLASRARRRVATAPVPDVDLGRQREVVDAYFSAARRGDFEALMALLHPGAVMRSDGGAERAHASLTRRGDGAVGEQARRFASMARFAVPVLVNGAAGVRVAPKGLTYAVMGFVVRDARIVAIDVLADPSRLRRLGLESSRFTGDGWRPTPGLGVAASREPIPSTNCMFVGTERSRLERQ